MFLKVIYLHLEFIYKRDVTFITSKTMEFTELNTLDQIIKRHLMY